MLMIHHNMNKKITGLQFPLTCKKRKKCHNNLSSFILPPSKKDNFNAEMEEIWKFKAEKSFL